ncbi:MAG TPA: WD40 repeat domain-containing protein [Thermoguttaceae bacterium]|nr:WD40 repeat domain-containing protein [Thermoguttaceae bacterium]
MRGHEGWVESVSYSPDGRRIVSAHRPLGSWCKTVRVWDAETGACIEVIRGSGDVAAIAAAGSSALPWRAMRRDQELVVERAAGGNVVARFPEALAYITTHPSGRTWAGASGNHLYIITLEGNP